jgi:preprotein translocase subunit SecA
LSSPAAPWAYPQRQDRRAQQRASLPLWLARRAWHSVQAALQPWLQWPQHRRLQAQVLAIQGAVQQALEQPGQLALKAAPALAQSPLTTTQRQQQALVFVATTASHVLGRQPYPTQLHAAWLLLQGHWVEMATGEGKTYAAGLAAAAAALCGTPVHVMTANDYLVQRDADSLAPLFAALGLSLGCVLATSTPTQRRAAYACQVTYCTAREAAFDYLRDAHAGSALKSQLQHHTQALLHHTGGEHAAAEPPVMRGLHLALIDEADSLLVDEAAMPLLLSAALASNPPAAAQQRSLAYQSLALARGLQHALHFNLSGDPAISLTPAGLAHIEQLAQPLGGAWLNRRHRQDLVTTALHALHGLQRDRDYLVQSADDSTTPATPPRVQLLDAVTGRVAHGRSWQAQLQTLVELKEGCPPSPAMQVVARLSLQRFFGRYLRLCGMSGTLAECASSLRASYGPAVHRVPLRLPSRRVQLTTQVFASADERLQQAVLRVQTLHAQGRPVLIGTDSVGAAQAFSAALQTAGVPHQRLDAKNSAKNSAEHSSKHGAKHSADHAFEATVVARAGQRGAVTVATHMAGRGTDITLGPGVAALGGLHVLCCQDNASARLDRQFVGRAARAGDPGSAELWRCSTAGVWQGTSRQGTSRQGTSTGVAGGTGSTPAVGVWLATAQRLVTVCCLSSRAVGRNEDNTKSTSRWAWALVRRAGHNLVMNNLVAAQNHHQRQHEHHRSLNRQQQLEQDLQWHTHSTT